VVGSDADGIQDSGESGLGSVTVLLTGTDALGSSVNRSTTTNTSGNYWFSGLMPGVYTVTVINPGNYVFSPADQGSDDTIDSDVNPATGSTAPITLISGQINSAVDAGFSLRADLSITKTDGLATAIPGTSVTYTITVSNAGPSTVNSVTVVETLPAALLNPVFTPSTGIYSSGTGVWTGLSLATGQSVTITLTGTISPMATGTVTNTVTVSPPTGVTDPNTGNNVATDDTTLQLDGSVIINDQDEEFTTVGEWHAMIPCVGNFNDDCSYAPAGTGGSVGTWQFVGFPPGVYRVSVTWLQGDESMRASNTPFTVRGSSGETPVTTRLNQKVAPADHPGALYDQGFYWVDVASFFSLQGHSLFVDVSNDADDYVVADAARIQRITSPEVAVSVNGTNVADNTGVVDFGVTQPCIPIARTFTVQNIGGSDLTLSGPITVPPGFTLVSSFGASTLAPGASTTFQVQFDAASIGLASGQLSFGNNDSDENPFNFTITAETAGMIVDDGDPGYATSGTWTAYTTGGYGGDLRYAAGGTGSSVATWTISGLTPEQTYQIGATWMRRPTGRPMQTTKCTTARSAPKTWWPARR
jgi:uncharacterized repeat protein (TIGR01451 family)